MLISENAWTVYKWWPRPEPNNPRAEMIVLYGFLMIYKESCIHIADWLNEFEFWVFLFPCAPLTFDIITYRTYLIYKKSKRLGVINLHILDSLLIIIRLWSMGMITLIKGVEIYEMWWPDWPLLCCCYWFLFWSGVEIGRARSIPFIDFRFRLFRAFHEIFFRCFSLDRPCHKRDRIFHGQHRLTSLWGWGWPIFGRRY